MHNGPIFVAASCGIALAIAVPAATAFPDNSGESIAVGSITYMQY